MEKQARILVLFGGLIGAVVVAAEKTPRQIADELFLAGKYGAAQRAYVTVERAATTDKQLAAFALFRQGLCSLADKQPLAAFTLWNRLRQFHPQSPYAATSLLLQADHTTGATQRDRLQEELLARFPQSPEAATLMLRRGEAAFGRHDYTGALAVWERFTGQFPAHPQTAAIQQRIAATKQLVAAASATAAQKLATIRQLTEAGKPDAALLLCEEIIRTNGQLPAGQEARYRKGLALAQQKKFAAAVACWQAITGGEWRDDARLDAARITGFHLHDYDRALAGYRQFFREHPQSDRLLEARYQFAGLHYLKKSYAEARDLFTEFLAEYPTSAVRDAAKRYLAECETHVRAAESVAVGRAVPSAPLPPPSPSSQLLAEANALFQRNDYKAAADIYQRLVTAHKTAPEYDLAAYRLGQCYAAREEFPRAVHVLEELAQWKSGSAHAAPALLLAGNLHLEELDQPAKAQSCYERAVALLRPAPTTNPQLAAPILSELHYRLGLALIAQQQWDKAKSVLEAERTARGGENKNAPPTELDRLITACEKRQPLTPARQKSLDQIEKQIAKADLLFTAKEYQKAVRAYEKVVKAKPGSEPAAYSLMQAGRCYNQLRNYQNALHCYRQFLDKYQSSQWADDALIRAGVIYVGPLRLPRKGAELYRIILDRYPTSNEADQAQFHLATLALWEKDWARALKLHEEFLSRFPTSRFVRLVRDQQIPAIQRELDKGMQPVATEVRR